jgi:hypothetical protein
MSDTVVSEKATKNIKICDYDINVLDYDIRDFTPFITAGKVDSSNSSVGSCPIFVGNDSIYYITPRMYCPFGLNENISPATADKPETKSYKISASITGYNNPDHKNYEKTVSYVGMIEALDDTVKQLGRQHSSEWIGQEDDGTDEFQEVVDAFYNPSLKPSVDKETKEPDGKYPPTQTFSLSYYQGNFSTEAYTQDSKPIDIKEAIVKGCSIKALVRAQKVTLVQGRFSIRHVIERMTVWPPKIMSDKSRPHHTVDDSDNDD